MRRSESWREREHCGGRTRPLTPVQTVVYKLSEIAGNHRSRHRKTTSEIAASTVVMESRIWLRNRLVTETREHFHLCVILCPYHENFFHFGHRSSSWISDFGRSSKCDQNITSFKYPRQSHAKPDKVSRRIP